MYTSYFIFIASYIEATKQISVEITLFVSFVQKKYRSWLDALKEKVEVLERCNLRLEIGEKVEVCHSEFSR